MIQARADSIRAAGRATLTIAYDRAGRVALAYTPFGVIAIAPQVAIYEMVPTSPVPLKAVGGGRTLRIEFR